MEAVDREAANRRLVLKKMKQASDKFYAMAAEAGCHQFLEFTGLMNEYIEVCSRAEDYGIDWFQAAELPFKEQHLRYLADKLDCIYGPALRRSHELASVFFKMEPKK